MTNGDWWFTLGVSAVALMEEKTQRKQDVHTGQERGGGIGNDVGNIFI